ncbi:MAG TPA: bifunctional lysylphosphatidylglycerol flippase/synthetase MprF [Vicinamibacteria bacterium]|nr:bifunctional lysylphosphatidylglycerol flippase/synthetase MprF [Vicinamibacteria bacterium]
MDEVRDEGGALKRLAPLVGAALFFAAIAVLHRELRDVHYHELSAALRGLPAGGVLLALALTTLNYIVLTGYDQLAVGYAGLRLHRGRVALTGFLSYAISNSLGFGMLSGAAVRFRSYTRWGVGAAGLSRIVLFQTTTFWLGLLVLGGATLGFAPHPWLRALPGAGLARGLGLALLGLGLAYALLPLVRRAPLRLGRFEVPVPTARLAAGQIALSVLDWGLAAAVLQALLPTGAVPFGELLGAFLAAQIAGLVSHVPGGLGVFDTLMVLALRPYLPAASVLPALVLYRAVYYLIPLAVALALLVVDEVRERRAHIARVGGALGTVTRAVAPRLLAVFTFLAGAVLLFSGATPSAPGRLAWMSGLLPLPLLEVSHFLGSLVGVGLLLVSRGVWRRLDAAYYLATTGLVLGIVASVLKGGDWEEAALLGLLVAAFAPSRAAFDRRAAFFDARFAPGWALAVVSVVAASVWLGFFSFKHVEYSHDLWWRFELEQDAPRFLRASVGAMVALLAFGTTRLLQPARPEVPRPSDEELTEAEQAIAAQGSTLPFLAFMRDKALLFDPSRRGFLMYGVRGRTWVALGDPVGPEALRRDLVRRFLERCDDHLGRPVFYQIGKETLHLYADFGLFFVKLGEEARVPLRGLSLDGPDRKPLRNALRRLEREGGGFRILPRDQVATALDGLRAVSDDWLARRGASEKGFSLGFFRDDYVRRFPAAVVEKNGRIVAFATVWPGPGKVELSVDLMRHLETAPRYTMEVLFAHLMLWGAEQGYQWFNLGMAPLSGLETSPLTPLWSRLGRIVYRRGESFYNFQGLRAFKEKFHPVWEPRYLAYPGGLSLPGVMADVSALVAGGYTRIFG